MISCVIPTYNRAATLAQCLAALYQVQVSEIGFEVIVVDDASTDATADVLRQAQDCWGDRLRVLEQEHRGPAAARNLGVAAARGELILFLDDDSIVEPGYLAHLYAVYQEHDGANHGVLGFVRYHPDSVSTPFGRWYETESNLQFAYRFAGTTGPLVFGLFYTASVLLPRQVLLAAGGFNSCFRHAAYEDTELSYRLAAQGFKLYFCPAARTVHIHPVTVRGVAARMCVLGRAAVTLAAVNPELFALLYPPTVGDFRSRHIKHRLRRWVLAQPGRALLAGLDNRLGWRLASRMALPILLNVQSYEMARLWAR